MFGKKKAKSSNSKDEGSSHYSLRMERRKKSSQANNYSAEYLCKNSSSSESLDISFRRKGFSLDRNESFDIEPKPPGKPKRSSWFLRDKNRDKQSKNEKFLKRASLDFTVTYDTKKLDKPRAKAKTIQRQNAADYTGDSSATPQEEIPEPKKSGLKRFFKGEIGIRSFNYYLLKEGLKKNQEKQKQESITAKPAYKSKSEENIYEEIYFRHDQPTPKPRTPPALPPFNKQTSIPIQQKNPSSDDGNCMNCEICLQEAQEKHSVCSLKNCDKCENSHHQKRLMTISLSGSEGYAQVPKRTNENSVYDFFKKQGQTVLEFQSYNPSDPSMYKIESTPVAFDCLEQQIYQMEFNQQNAPAQQNLSGEILAKSSSSSDSIKGHNQHKRQQQLQQQSNEFYTRPNFFYQSTDKPSRRHQGNSMYKTDSSNSIHSENSLNQIYNSKNSSQKSNRSNKSVNSNHNREETQLRQDMSDSSLGDSLFSSDANKRYFGSSESCRLNYECTRRRCSLEKCSYSDVSNLQNCDCSSSYFSSDFDDTNVYNTTSNNNRMMKSYRQQPADYEQAFEKNTNRYAEDFIKHVNNVKRRSQNIPFDGSNVIINSQNLSIYEVPKLNHRRLDTEAPRSEHDSNKVTVNCPDEMTTRESEKMSMYIESDKTSHSEKSLAKSTGTVPKLLSSSISSNDSKKKKKTNENHNKEDKQSDSNRSQEGVNESLLKAKVPEGDENIASLKTEMAAKEKPDKDSKNPVERDSQCKNEQQTNIDEDDDVFLDNHKIRDAENKTVSTASCSMSNKTRQRKLIRSKAYP